MSSSSSLSEGISILSWRFSSRSVVFLGRERCAGIVLYVVGCDGRLLLELDRNFRSSLSLSSSLLVAALFAFGCHDTGLISRDGNCLAGGLENNCAALASAFAGWALR
jgi:hypothetical protein